MSGRAAAGALRSPGRRGRPRRRGRSALRGEGRSTSRCGLKAAPRGFVGGRGRSCVAGLDATASPTAGTSFPGLSTRRGAVVRLESRMSRIVGNRTKGNGELEVMPRLRATAAFIRGSLGCGRRTEWRRPLARLSAAGSLSRSGTAGVRRYDKRFFSFFFR